MKIIVAEDYVQLSRIASDIIAAKISKKPNLVLGLATGHTPLGLYHQLIEKYRKGEINFSKVTVFNLDEYLGASPSEKESFNYYLHKNFLDQININRKNIKLLRGKPGNVEAECKRYDRLLSKHRIDLQLLGIGVNAHIGFDEPGTSFKSKTHLADLTEETIRKNFKNKSKKFTQALTMGISNIMAAREILLLADGAEKVDAVKAMLYKEISEKIPASILRSHPNFTLVITRNIADKISEKLHKKCKNAGVNNPCVKSA